MRNTFTFTVFFNKFSNDLACLEEIKRLRFPDGIDCIVCRSITEHYKLKNRMCYECRFCRHQVYPLAGTIFERSSTPLSVWFYAIFLMTSTRADMSAKNLQRELRVSYKTAWRIYASLRKLMEQNNGDLLSIEERGNIFHWTLFNKLEFKITQKKE